MPVLFLLQWNEEHVERGNGLASDDAFASPVTTLHADPGGHVEVPGFEFDRSATFVHRHLGPASWQARRSLHRA